MDDLFGRNQVSVVVVPYNNSVALLSATCIADGVPLGLQLTLDGFTFVLVYDVGEVLISKLSTLCNANVVYSDKYLPQLADLFDDSVLLFGQESKKGYKNSLTECGNFTIVSKSGTIKVTNGWGITL